MNSTTTDRIEKKATLKADRSRVWRAISDAQEFGTWFQVKLDGPFRAGEHNSGHMTFPGHEDSPFEIWVDRMEPETLFSFRWHPYAIEKGVDYSREPMTLVEFRLDDGPEGTHLTITESGFDGVTLARRATAFASNGEGWTIQIKALVDYVDA